MESLYLLIPIALVFTALAIKIFFWAIDSKQFDDLDSASKSILFDDDPINKIKQNNKNDPDTNPSTDENDD
jgi:cbb3-type cytochrome oxidase maturation protein